MALNTRPKFVASRTLDKVTWNNSHLLKGDVAEEVAKLKAQEGGEIQVHGSSDLLQTLLKHDLIDTLRIWQFPVLSVPVSDCSAQAPSRQLLACRFTADRWWCCPSRVRTCRGPQIRRSGSRARDGNL